MRVHVVIVSLHGSNRTNFSKKHLIHGKSTFPEALFNENAASISASTFKNEKHLTRGSRLLATSNGVTFLRATCEPSLRDGCVFQFTFSRIQLLSEQLIKKPKQSGSADHKMSSIFAGMDCIERVSVFRRSEINARLFGTTVYFSLNKCVDTYVFV